MKAKCILYLFALLLLAPQLFGQQQIERGHVVGISDGDTISVLTTDKQLLRIRVAWIDAPEMGQAFGYRAKQGMNLEHRSDPPNLANPVVTRAEFTYSMTLDRVKIIDLGRGKTSVTNDFVYVLRKIEAWHQGSVAGHSITDRPL